MIELFFFCVDKVPNNTEYTLYVYFKGALCTRASIRTVIKKQSMLRLTKFGPKTSKIISKKDFQHIDENQKVKKS